jgi:hypothetical protein
MLQQAQARIATRYDRRTIRFKGFALIAATMVWQK